MSLLEERIKLMVRLGHHFRENNEEWQNVAEKAERANAWFTQAYIGLAVHNISEAFLDESRLRAWLAGYPAAGHDNSGLSLGLVMAGNIPLVGFHDFLCAYIAGFRLRIKLSAKDTVLWEHILQLLGQWDGNFSDQVATADMLKGCDAYIATGSNNSARYFEQYFRKYPHIIRRNRTSVAVLDGTETPQQLEQLADDVCVYFGLGCRNVTKLWVPEGYAFEHLLPYFDRYGQHIDHNKYKNNYDFQLAIFLLNNIAYMTNGSLLLVPGESPFAAISVLHYEYYTDKEALLSALAGDDRLQCVATATGSSNTQAFGSNQQPGLSDYADGVDTMAFLGSLGR